MRAPRSLLEWVSTFRPHHPHHSLSSPENTGCDPHHNPRIPPSSRPPEPGEASRAVTVSVPPTPHPGEEMSRWGDLGLYRSWGWQVFAGSVVVRIEIEARYRGGGALLHPPGDRQTRRRGSEDLPPGSRHPDHHGSRSRDPPQRSDLTCQNPDPGHTFPPGRQDGVGRATVVNVKPWPGPGTRAAGRCTPSGPEVPHSFHVSRFTNGRAGGRRTPCSPAPLLPSPTP